MIINKIVELEDVLPQYHPDLYNKPYSCQNILIDQFNFPLILHPGDYYTSVYSDRDHKRITETAQKHLGKHVFFCDIYPYEQMLSFLTEYFEHDLTGYQVTRHTNIATGRPLYLLKGFAMGPEAQNRQLCFGGLAGPNILPFGDDW